MPCQLALIYVSQRIHALIDGFSLARLLCIDRSQTAANTPGAVALPLDVAHAVSFLKPQGGTAFLGYLNDPATEGLKTLDTQLTIKALTKVARRILFYPIRLK
jgi:hypothetical protein